MELLIGTPTCEYFCKDCGQLRLSFLNETTQCGNCKSNDIIKGDIGELNKVVLTKEITHATKL